MDNKDTITIETDIKYHDVVYPHGKQNNPLLISLKNYINDNSSIFLESASWQFEIFIYFIHDFYIIKSSKEYYIKIDYNRLDVGDFHGGYLKLDDYMILPFIRNYKLDKIKEKI